MRRIGIDVGGTNTDAVLIEDGKVAGAVKAPTSEDVTTGILDSLKALGATGVVNAKKIDGVMIGTTHFINAVVQRRHLTKVAALRLGMPASASYWAARGAKRSSARRSTLATSAFCASVSLKISIGLLS